MRILIAGGTGLIGRPLSNSLAADGHDVIVLSRSPEKASGLGAGGRIERWDAHTAEGWGHLADGADAIVNLAGESLAGSTFFPRRWSDERKRLFLESRVNAGQAVNQAVEAASSKPKVVIQASATGYYGQTGDAHVTEGSPAGDDFQAQVCAAWEKSTAPVEEMGVRRAIVRTGVVLSTEGGAFPRLLLPFRLFAGGPLGDGRQWMPWIHLEDEMRAIRFLIENERASGPFNLSAPNPVTNAQMARVIGRVMGRPSFVPVPGFALRLAFGEAATLVLDGWRALPERLQTLGFEFRFPGAESAVRDLLESR
jgi:uncharacterized protein (TIGR01777 family)